jgi:hypothetical protein
VPTTSAARPTAKTTAMRVRRGLAVIPPSLWLWWEGLPGRRGLPRLRR